MALAIIFLILAHSAQCKRILYGENKLEFRMELLHRDSPSSSFPYKATSMLQRIQQSAYRNQALTRRRLASDAFQAPVASARGEYLMEIEVGNPPQKFQAILDTGSDLVWLQCRPCMQCVPQRGSYFQPGNSTTYIIHGCGDDACNRIFNSKCVGLCDYFYVYTDSTSTSGVISSDTMFFTTSDGDRHEFPAFHFGCGHNQTGDLFGSAGVVGFNRGPMSLPSQLEKMVGKKFSYCLVRFDIDPNKTSPLIFSSMLELQGSQIQFTPLIDYMPQQYFYYVNLVGISVAGNRLQIMSADFSYNQLSGDGGTILDSGTASLVFYPRSTYEVVRQAFEDAILLPRVNGTGFLCFNMSNADENYTFPQLVLHFEGADLSPPDSNYFVSTEEDVKCLAMTWARFGPSIVGNLLQQNLQVLYDLEQSVVSFQHIQCDLL